MIKKANAKYEATVAAVSILRNHGFRADSRDFPRDKDREKIEQAFGDVMNDLEKDIEKLRLKGADQP